MPVSTGRLPPIAREASAVVGTTARIVYGNPMASAMAPELIVRADPSGWVGPALDAVRRVLLPVRDILEGRVEEEVPPPWCEGRGWTNFLLNMDDANLRRCEAQGFSSCLPSMPAVPHDLATLAANVGALVRLRRLPMSAAAPPLPAFAQ